MNNSKTSNTLEDNGIAPVSTNNIEQLLESDDMPDTANGNNEKYDIEPAPDTFDLDKLLDSSAGSNSKKNMARPNEPHIAIPKSEMLNIFKISDLVLSSKLLTGNGQWNFIEISITQDSDMVCIKFCNKQNYVSIKVAATNVNMVSDSIAFYIGDIKSYVYSCSDSDFIITGKDVEQGNHKANLFDKYVYVKTGIDYGEKKNYNIFSDQYQYSRYCVVDAAKMCEFFRPLARVTDKKEKENENRICFHDNHAVVACTDGSFLAQSCPENFEFPNCAVSGSFINILSALISDDCKGQAEISQSQNGRIKIDTVAGFEVSGVTYSYNAKGVQEKLDTLRSLQKEKFVKINNELLGRIIGYSCNARLSKGVLALDYFSDGAVKCCIVNKDGENDYNYIIPLSKENPTQCSPLKKTVLISSKSLKRLLKAYAWGVGEDRSREVEIHINANRVSFKSGDIYIVLNQQNV